MEHIQVTDEWLYQYMPVVDEAIIRELEENTDYEYCFSGKFRRKMKIMMWKEAHLWGNGIYRQLKHAAAWFCCIVTTVFLFSMSVEGNRIKFFETVRSLGENNSVNYTYVSHEESGVFHEKEPGFVPDGYEETERVITDIHFMLTFENGMNQMVTWDQWLISDAESITIDTEFDSEVTEEVSGKYVTIYSYSDGYKLAYCEHEKYVYIMAADDLTIDEICKMFEF